MNGFTMMADSYRELMNNGKIDIETAEKKIRIYDFFATCDIDDFCLMVDSSAFNDIIRAFLKMAVNNAIDELEEREQYILDQRFVIGKTQTELASELGISQAQISRIEKNAIKTLKKVIK